MDNFFLFFAKIFFPYKIFKWMQKFFYYIRSLWICDKFANCSKSVRFGKIGRIHGPQYISIGKGSFFDDFLFLTAWDTNISDSKEIFSDGKIEFSSSKNGFIQHMHPQLTIGDGCSFGAFNHITCTNKIKIGNNVLVGKWVTITDNSHGNTDINSLKTKPSRRPIVSKGPVIIGNNVWIGDKATILAGVTIGNNAVIGANSIVTHDIPDFAIAVGNPAKILKTCAQG